MVDFRKQKLAEKDKKKWLVFQIRPPQNKYEKTKGRPKKHGQRAIPRAKGLCKGDPSGATLPK